MAAKPKKNSKPTRPATKAPAKKMAQKPSITAKRTAPINPFAGEFMHLKSEIDKAFKQLKRDIQRKESPRIVQKDYNHFLLLLGEMDFLAKECYRIQHKQMRDKSSFLL